MGLSESAQESWRYPALEAIQGCGFRWCRCRETGVEVPSLFLRLMDRKRFRFESSEAWEWGFPIPLFDETVFGGTAPNQTSTVCIFSVRRTI